MRMCTLGHTTKKRIVLFGKEIDFWKFIRKIRCLNVIEQRMRCVYRTISMTWFIGRSKLTERMPPSPSSSSSSPLLPYSTTITLNTCVVCGFFYTRPCHSHPSHLHRSHSTLSFGARHYYRTSIPPRSTFKA